MGGGFVKEGGTVGPIVAVLDRALLVGGILIYMGFCSLAGEEEDDKDDNDYKHDNDDDYDDELYDSCSNFPGRVVVGPKDERWNKGGGGGSDNHDNHNDNDNDVDDSTIKTKN